MSVAVEGTCYDCGEPCEKPFIYHAGCCPHDEEIIPVVRDDGREDPERGTCDDCGAHVHAEYDGEYDLDGVPHVTTQWVED